MTCSRPLVPHHSVMTFCTSRGRPLIPYDLRNFGTLDLPQGLTESCLHKTMLPFAHPTPDPHVCQARGWNTASFSEPGGLCDEESTPPPTSFHT